jgi:hypothetical protein
MRYMNCGRLIVVVGACTALALGCTRPTPAPPVAARDSVTVLSLFTDTTIYRRYCVVAAGRPVDLEEPCLLLDQGHRPGIQQRQRQPPAPRP